MLDCDGCGQPFWKAAPSADSEPLLWASYAHDLKTMAEIEGWDIDPNIMVCPDCKAEAESEDVHGNKFTVK